MIRFFVLFLRLRLRLALGGFRLAAKKGGFARFGAWLSVIAPVLVALLVLGAALVLGAGAWVAIGALTGGEPQARSVTLVLLRIATLLFTVLVALLPAVRAVAGGGARGDASGLTRLLLMPLSRRHLHSFELLSGLADPWLLAVLPAFLILGAGLGVQAGPLQPVTLGLGLLAAVLFVAALTALGSMLGIGVTLLLRDRRRAETVLLVGMTAWLLLAMLPGVLDTRRETRENHEPAGVASNASGRDEVPLAVSGESAGEPSSEEGSAVRDGAAPADRVLEGGGAAEEGGAAEPANAAEDESLAGLPASEGQPAPDPLPGERFPAWAQVLPSEAFARSLAVLSKGELLAALPSLAGLAVFTVLAWAASWRLWGRLIGSPASAGPRARVDPERLRLPVLPGTRPGTSAVALATARGFLRTVRGKLALVVTPLTVAFIGYVFLRGSETVPELGGGSFDAFLHAGAIALSLLALLPLSANQLATDGAGLTLQCLAPLGERQLVRGKALGCLLFYLPCLVLAVLGAGLATRQLDPLSIVTTLALGTAVQVSFAPLGSWISILFPKKADLSSLGRAGNPTQVAQFLAMLGIGALLGLGLVTTSLAGWIVGAPWGRLLGAVVHALAALLVAWPLLDAAAAALRRRREVVLSTAVGR